MPLLRSFVLIPPSFYKHLVPTALTTQPQVMN